MAIATQISEQEYRRLALEDGDVQWELHHGALREKPGMSVAHSRFVSDLAFSLHAQVDPSLYVVRSNMSRLRRPTISYYIPDVVVIPASLEAALFEQPTALDAYEAPMSLVVEVWSPSTGGYDAGTKVDEYRARGDEEIWYVHPYQRTLTAWRRQADGSYVDTVYHGGIVRPESLPGVETDLDLLFPAASRP